MSDGDACEGRCVGVLYEGLWIGGLMGSVDGFIGVSIGYLFGLHLPRVITLVG